jgi:hypothetical protein
MYTRKEVLRKVLFYMAYTPERDVAKPAPNPKVISPTRSSPHDRVTNPRLVARFHPRSTPRPFLVTVHGGLHTFLTDGFLNDKYRYKRAEDDTYLAVVILTVNRCFSGLVMVVPYHLCSNADLYRPLAIYIPVDSLDRHVELRILVLNDMSRP